MRPSSCAQSVGAAFVVWHASAAYTLARLIHFDATVGASSSVAQSERVGWAVFVGAAALAAAALYVYVWSHVDARYRSAVDATLLAAPAAAPPAQTEGAALRAAHKCEQNTLEYAGIMFYATVVSGVFAAVATSDTPSLTLEHAYTAHTCTACVTLVVYFASVLPYN